MKSFFNKRKNNGFTLVEVLISIFILSLILLAVAAFQSGIFKFNRIISTGLLNQQEAKKLIRPFSNEVRGAISSSLGGYPIAVAGTSTLVFFTDLNGDGLPERVKYFFEDGTFKKSIIEPHPTTYQYNQSNEKIVKVIHDILDKPIFYYFDSSYNGTESSQPLEQPVIPSDVRMIKIILEIDSNPNSPPAPFIVTTQVSIRNLKDNL